MIRVLIGNHMYGFAACKNQNNELKDAKTETGDNCGFDARSALIQELILKKKTIWFKWTKVI